MPKSPVITKQPEQTIKVLKDGEITLSVSVSSPDGGALSYQWYRAVDVSAEGAAISAATSASCTVKADSESYYYVVVMNTKNGQTVFVTSRRAHIVITENPEEVVPPKPPLISEQPSGGTVKKGNAYVLSIKASAPNGGELSYQWYRTTDKSSEGVAIDGAGAATYALGANDASAEAYYYAVVTNTLNGRTESVKSTVVEIKIERISVTVDAGSGCFSDSNSTMSLSIIPGESLAAVIKKTGLPTITADGETCFADCFLDKESADNPDFNEWNYDYAGLLWQPIEKESAFVAQYHSIDSHHIEFYNKNAEDLQNAWNLLYKNLEKNADGYFVLLPVTERGQKFRITSKWCTFFYGDGTAPAALKLDEPVALKPVLHSGDDSDGGTIDVEPGVYKLGIAVQTDGSLKVELNAVPNEPYTGDYVYIVGGITESALESGGTAIDCNLSGNDSVWKIPVSNGAFSFEFTYAGNDMWGGNYGEHIFAILSNIDNGWECDFRWGDAVVSAGSEGVLSATRLSNIIIRKLVQGARYTVSGKVQHYAGTLSVTSGEGLPPAMDLVFAGNEPVQMTPVSASEFEYAIPASSSVKTVQFCVNYGDKWWGGLHQLTVGNKIELSVSAAKPDSDMTFSCEAGAKYVVRIKYEEVSGNITVCVSEDSLLGRAGVVGSFNAWVASSFKKNGGIYTYDFTANATEIEFVIQEEAGNWSIGRWFKGMQWTGMCDDIVAAKKNAVPTAVTPIYFSGDSGMDGKNLKISGLPYKTGYKFRLSAAVVDEASKKISLTVQALDDIPDEAFLRPDSQYKVDGISYICSNYGIYEITWGDKMLDGSYEGTVTIPAGTENSWGGENKADIQFCVTADTAWTAKYTGGVLLESDVSYCLTKDSTDNNVIRGINPSMKDVVITVISTEDSISVKYRQ